jgi:hypothetical protein
MRRKNNFRFLLFRFRILAIDDYVILSYEKCVEERETKERKNKLVMMLKENE